MKKNITITLIGFIITLNVSNLCYAQFTKLHDFTYGTTGTGNRPYGSLVSDGTFLYGMTSTAGTNNQGTIFKIMPDGTGYSKLLDFGVNSDGSYPQSTLFYDGIFLYGMTSLGGLNNYGTIFKIMPNGTGYTKLLDFDGTTNGRGPAGSLISDGTFLYGMTHLGGTGTCNSGCGVIFKIKPDGTGYSMILDFAGTTNGSWTEGSLLSDGTFLYGMTQTGGTNSLGTIFKIMPDGTLYTKLLDFAGVSNGSTPQGDLFYDGTFLYGMTQHGGSGNCSGGCGVLFKIKPDGTGYSKLIDFIGTNGSSPFGSLISDGTYLYGMTSSGGSCSFTSGCGTIFKVKPDGTGYAKMLDFSGSPNGSSPFGDLISDGNFLYGMSAYGGTSNCTNGCGVIFKCGLLTTAISENKTEADFNVYPNPSNGIFTIETDYIFFVTDVIGKNIYHSGTKNQKTVIDLSKQPNGIYFLNMKTENGIISKKLVLNR